MRILQVSDAYYPFPGGVSEHLRALSEALRRRGHEVDILTARYPGTYRDPPGVHRIGRVWVFPFNQTRITLTVHPALPWAVWRFLRRHRYDVVHTHGPLAPNLPAAVTLLSPYPVVSTFHTAFAGRWNWYRLARWAFRPVWRKVRVAIAVSRVARDVMKPYFPGDYRIVPNGVDLARFSPEGPVHPVYRDLSGPAVLFLGRMEPRKGPHLLLAAFVRLAEQMPDVHLVMGGDGPLRETLIQQVPPHLRHRVHFPGHVPFEDLPKLYRGATVYTSPAVGGETFGLVLLEAMASGVPVVAAGNPGYREVIRNGVNGLLVDVRDREAYARALGTLLHDPAKRQAFVREGLATARRFSWDAVARKVEAIYTEVCAGGVDRNPPAAYIKDGEQEADDANP